MQDIKPGTLGAVWTFSSWSKLLWWKSSQPHPKATRTTNLGPATRTTDLLKSFAFVQKNNNLCDLRITSEWTQQVWEISCSCLDLSDHLCPVEHFNAILDKHPKSVHTLGQLKRRNCLAHAWKLKQSPGAMPTFSSLESCAKDFCFYLVLGLKQLDPKLGRSSSHLVQILSPRKM